MKRVLIVLCFLLINCPIIALSRPTQLSATLDHESSKVMLSWEYGYSDSFDQGLKEKWHGVNGQWSVEEGTCRVSKDSTQFSTMYYDTQYYDNFIFQADVRKTEGSDDNIGLNIFGSPFEQTSYGSWSTVLSFVVKDNYWILWASESGSGYPVSDSWQSINGEYNSGLGAWNRLKIAVKNGLVSLYINGNLQDTYSYSGNAGYLGLSMKDDNAGKGEYDNILISPAFQKFEIYRNNTLIDTTTALAWEEDLSALPPGEYRYHVVAEIDDNTDSDPSEQSTVQWQPAPTTSVRFKQVSPNPTDGDPQITITAQITGSLEIASAEFFMDQTGDGGTGVPFDAVDGNFDGLEEDVTAIFAIPENWSPGEHTLYARGIDSAGMWHSFSTVTILHNVPGTLLVPGEYQTIQAAVDAAVPGDVIKLSPGVYTEAVKIDKAVVLEGESADSVVISGADQHVPLTISGDGGVKVKQITFSNAYLCGIKINENAGSNVVEDCVVDKVKGNDSSSIHADQGGCFGIWIHDSNNNQILRTKILNVLGYVYGSWNASVSGIELVNTRNTLIKDCDIDNLTGGKVRGIYVYNNSDNTWPDYGNKIEGCRILNLSAHYARYTIGSYGISVDQVHGLIISDVDISDISCIDYNGWDPSKHYDVEGIRIDDSKRVHIKGCSFKDILHNGAKGSPYCINIMGRNTSDAVIGGAEADANSFGVHRGYNIYVSATSAVNATYNYWPVDDPEDLIYDQLDWEYHGRVDSSFALQDIGPRITSEPLNIAYNGVPYEYKITVEDVDGDPIEIVAGRIPEGFTLKDNGNGTATLSGIPSNDWIAYSDGKFAAVEAVSGPTRKTDKQYLHIVVEPNTALPSIPQGTATVDKEYTYTFAPTQHISSGELRTALQKGPDWLSFKPDTGKLSGIPEPSDMGVHEVILSCTDDSGWQVNQTYSLTVLPGSVSYGLWSDGYPVEDVVLHNGYAYAVGQNGLHVLDLADPLNPKKIAHIADLGGNNVAVDGHRLAISSKDAFRIIDIADPSMPKLLKSYSIDGCYPGQLRYEEDKIFILENVYSYIIDVSDPLPPDTTLLYSGYHGSGAQWERMDDIDVEGNLLGIIGGYDIGLLLYDISDPSAPVSLDSPDSGWGYPYSPRIDIYGGVAHMTSSKTYFTNKGTLIELDGHSGNNDDYGNVSSNIELKALADKIYVASSNGGIDVIQSGKVVYSYPDTANQFVYALDVDGKVVAIAAENGLYTLNAYNEGDKDMDGLDDNWEIQYFGSTDLWTGSDDPDNDGNLNAFEQKNKSIPTDKNSAYHKLSVTIIGSGTVSCDPVLELYPKGAEIEVAADSLPGFRFVRWLGDDVSTSYRLSLNVEKDISLKAWFIDLDQSFNFRSILKIMTGQNIASAELDKKKVEDMNDNGAIDSIEAIHCIQTDSGLKLLP